MAATKQQKIGLDFEFKSEVAQVLFQSLDTSGLVGNPESGLVYDGSGIRPVQDDKHMYLNNGTDWRKLLMDVDLSGNIDFTVDPTFLADRETIKNYVDSIVSSIGTFKGDWDASGGTTPTGAPGDIDAGDSYRITVPGTLTGLGSGDEDVQVGDIIISRVSDPSSNADYFALQGNFTDSNDILVGATWTPQVHTITQNSSVHEALESLQFSIDNIDIVAALEAAAGDGIVWDSVNTHYDIDLVAPGTAQSGLELSGIVEGDRALQIRGLQDYTALGASEVIRLGYNNSFGVVADKAAVSGLLAGSGLELNVGTGLIDLGGPLTKNTTLTGDTGTYSLNLGTSVDQLNNLTADLAGNLILNADGDITLDSEGNVVTTGTDILFNATGTLNIDASEFTVSVGGDSGGAGQVLALNAATTSLEYIDLSAAVSVNNALTNNAGTIQFGGPLVANTNVNGATSFNLTFDQMPQFTVDVTDINLTSTTLDLSAATFLTTTIGGDSGSTGQGLVSDGVGRTVWGSLAANVNVDNGLNYDAVSETIQLGGALTENTFIDGAFDLLIGNTTQLNEFRAVSSNGALIQTFAGAVNSIVSTDTNGITLGATNGANQVTNIINSTSHTISSINAGFTGAQYGADYSANFVDRSLIDKQYADTHLGSYDLGPISQLPTSTQDGYVISWDNANNQYELLNPAILIAADNGLSIDGTTGVIELGGNLYQQTEVSGNFTNGIIFREMSAILLEAASNGSITLSAGGGLGLIDLVAQNIIVNVAGSTGNTGEVLGSNGLGGLAWVAGTDLSASAGSGLTYNGITEEIDLGGNLTENTLIELDGSTFTIKDSTSPDDPTFTMSNNQVNLGITKAANGNGGTFSANGTYARMTYGQFIANPTELSVTADGINISGSNYDSDYPVTGETANLSIDEFGNIVIGESIDFSSLVENGLRYDAVSKTIKIGGSFTENTEILGGGFSFSVGTTANRLKSFNTRSSTGFDIEADNGSASTRIGSNVNTGFLRTNNTTTGQFAQVITQFNSVRLFAQDSTGANTSNGIFVNENGIFLTGDDWTPQYPSTGELANLVIDENGIVSVEDGGIVATKLAGDGLIANGTRIDVDLADGVNPLLPISGLELTATDGTGELRIRGLLDYTAGTLSTVRVGYGDFGNVVVDVGGIGNSLAGSGLTFNATTNEIDWGGTLTADTTINGQSGTYDVNFTDLDNFSISTQVNGGTGVVSIGASGGLEITTGATAITIAGSTYTPNYPTAGNTSLLGVDENGEILILGDAAAAVKFAATITGDGTTEVFTLTHNKNTTDIIVQVYDNTTGEQVGVGVDATGSSTTADIIFSVAPLASESFRVIII